MRYRKSILPGLWHTLPLAVFTLIMFSIIFAYGYYYIILLPILFTFLVVYRILDDYLDYIELNKTGMVINISRGLYHSSKYDIPYNNIAYSSNRSFWQKIFGLGTMIIQSEGKSFTIKNISEFQFLIYSLKKIQKNDQL